jgi:hypothetical protein
MHALLHQHHRAAGVERHRWIRTAGDIVADCRIEIVNRFDWRSCAPISRTAAKSAQAWTGELRLRSANRHQDSHANQDRR